MTELDAVVKAALTDEETGWNMGSFGAIAEFHHVAGDPSPEPRPGHEQLTARGGIRIDRLDHDDRLDLDERVGVGA